MKVGKFLKNLVLKKVKTDNSNIALRLLDGQSCVDCCHEQLNLFQLFPPMFHDGKELKEVHTITTSGSGLRCTLSHDNSKGVCEWWSKYDRS